MRGRGVTFANVWMLRVHLVRKASPIISEAKIELIDTSDPVRIIPEAVVEVTVVGA